MSIQKNAAASHSAPCLFTGVIHKTFLPLNGLPTLPNVHQLIPWCTSYFWGLASPQLSVSQFFPNYYPGHYYTTRWIIIAQSSNTGRWVQLITENKITASKIVPHTIFIYSSLLHLEQVNIYLFIKYLSIACRLIMVSYNFWCPKELSEHQRRKTWTYTEIAQGSITREL